MSKQPRVVRLALLIGLGLVPALAAPAHADPGSPQLARPKTTAATNTIGFDKTPMGPPMAEPSTLLSALTAVIAAAAFARQRPRMMRAQNQPAAATPREEGRPHIPVGTPSRQMSR